jgi:hypothetical protein
MVLKEHSRMLYKMQEAEVDSDSDDDSDLSVYSRSRRGRGHVTRRAPARSGKKRMSILTNQYVELPPDEEYTDFAGFDPHRPTIRRFFGAVDVPTWEDQHRERGDQDGEEMDQGPDKVAVDEALDEDMNTDDV